MYSFRLLCFTVVSGLFVSTAALAQSPVAQVDVLPISLSPGQIQSLSLLHNARPVVAMTQNATLIPDGLPVEAVLSAGSSLALVANAIAVQSAPLRRPVDRPVFEVARLQMSRQIHAIGLDVGHNVRVHFGKGKTLTGKIMTITPDFFILQTPKPANFHTIYYTDLEYSEVLPTPAERFKKGGQTTLMVILLLPFFPFFLAAGVVGWDGC